MIENTLINELIHQNDKNVFQWHKFYSLKLDSMLTVYIFWTMPFIWNIANL